MPAALLVLALVVFAVQGAEVHGELSILTSPPSTSFKEHDHLKKSLRRIEDHHPAGKNHIIRVELYEGLYAIDGVHMFKGIKDTKITNTPNGAPNPEIGEDRDFLYNLMTICNRRLATLAIAEFCGHLLVQAGQSACRRRVRNTESNGISVLGDFNHETFPKFAEPIPNVTVTVGRDALLACVVDNLRGFKVAWVRVDTQTILSIHHNVITQNPRISLSYNDHRSWYLHIKNVQEADRGWYMCQVNTDPMRSRQGYLQVVVPPSIVDRETSSDMVVLESTNVSLTCKATGYPEPYVMWRREDGENYRYNGENVNVVDGEVLFITKVSRLHMANYLCIASNGVPPSISKRVSLRVQFPPMLTIPNQLEGAYVGQDVALECHTEAFPTSINYWTTERGDMIISGDKYEAVSMDSGYKKYMMLKIRNVGQNDFGSYKCVAKNSLGETDGVIKLEEIPAPTTVRTTTHFPTMLPKKKARGRAGDRRERGGGTDENRVVSGKSDEGARTEYDYDGEFTLPSNRPHTVHEPPGVDGAPSPRTNQNQAPALLLALLTVLCNR